MPDTFADLDTLAANGDGTLWRRDSVWSYPGCPTTSPVASNLRLPIATVPDARVQAALQAGAWVAAWIDRTASPTRLLAVVKAPSDGSAVRVRSTAEMGSAA